MTQMAKLLPSAHIIILLRDPIIRAISEFDDNCKNGEYIRLIKPILIPYLTPKIEKSNTMTKKEFIVSGNIGNKLDVYDQMKEMENIMMDGNKKKEGQEGEEERVRMFFLPERSVMRMSSLQFLLELSSASYYTSSTSSRHDTTHTTHNNTHDNVKLKTSKQYTTTFTPPPSTSTSSSYSTFLSSLSSNEHSSPTFERTFFPLPPIDGYTVSTMWKINRNVLEQSIRILSSCTKKDFHDYYFGFQENKNEVESSEKEDENENENSTYKNKKEKDKNGLRGSEKGRERRYKNVLPLKHPNHYTDPVSSPSTSSSSSSSASSISSSLSSSSFTSSTPSSTSFSTSTSSPPYPTSLPLLLPFRPSPPLFSILPDPPSGSPTSSPLLSVIPFPTSSPTSSPLSSTSKESSNKEINKPSETMKRILQNSPKLLELSANSSSSSSSSSSKSNSERKREGVMRRRLKENTPYRSDSHSHSSQAHTPDNRHNNIITHTRTHADTDKDMTTCTDIHTHTRTDIHTRKRTDSTYADTYGIKRIKSSRSLLESNSTTHPQSPPTPTTAPNSNSEISPGSPSVIDSRISSSSVIEFNSMHSEISPGSPSVSDSRISSSSVIEFHSMHFAAEERSHGLYDVLIERVMKR